jgi:DNA invertase Pin-like site-specific DNA recombinase
LGQKIGYARVSTSDGRQTTDLQTDALSGDGCARIFTDMASGSKIDRKGLLEALDYARPGDILVVWRLDRLGRSLRHLIDVIIDLYSRGIGFRSVNESIDTTTPGGRLIFHIFGALAEFEKSIITERVNAGLIAARRRGRVGGRPTVIDASKASAIKVMTEQGMAVAEICKSLGISRSTYFRQRRETLV